MYEMSGKQIKVTFVKPTCAFIMNIASLSHINSSPPSAIYMRQWIGSALVQIMACRLFGAKPLSKQMQGYYQFDPKEQVQF